MMVISPLVERELQRALRKRWPYRLRMTTAITSFLLATFAYSATHVFPSPSASGRWLFFSLSTGAFFLCLLSGPFITSFSLREEKQTRMLDLLLLSRVGPFGIMVSKLLTHANPAVQVLLGVFPVLMIPLLFGGVSSSEILRMSLLCITSLVFSSVLGLFSAACCQSGRTAFIVSLFLILGYSLGSFGIDRQLAENPDLYFLSGPLQALATTSDLVHSISPLTFVTCIASLLILTVGLMATTVRALAHAPSTPMKPSACTINTSPSQSKKRTHRYRRIRSNPAKWLAAKRQWNSIAGSFLILGTLLSIALAYAFQPWFPVPNNHLHLILYPLAAHGIFKVMLAAKSIQLLIDCRRTGELEILLSTPIQDYEIYDGFRTAILRGYKNLFILVLLTDATTLILSTLHLSSPARDQILWLLVWGMIVMLVIDGWALTWMGSWEGIRCHKPIEAYSKTFRYAVLYPTIVFIVTVGISPFFLIQAKILGAESLIVGAILWWWIVGFVFKASFAFSAKRALSENFRHTLAIAAS